MIYQSRQNPSYLSAANCVLGKKHQRAEGRDATLNHRPHIHALTVIFLTKTAVIKRQVYKLKYKILSLWMLKPWHFLVKMRYKCN